MNTDAKTIETSVISDGMRSIAVYKHVTDYCHLIRHVDYQDLFVDVRRACRAQGLLRETRLFGLGSPLQRQSRHNEKES